MLRENLLPGRRAVSTQPQQLTSEIEMFVIQPQTSPFFSIICSTFLQNIPLLTDCKILTKKYWLRVQGRWGGIWSTSCLPISPQYIQLAGRINLKACFFFSDCQPNPLEKTKLIYSCRSQTAAVMGCLENLKIDRLLSLEKDERC